MSDEIPTQDSKKAEEFMDLRTQGVDTDFEIRVNDKSFKVHQEILIKRSEYFQTVLTSHDSEVKCQGFLEVKNVTGKAVEICIEYFYTGKVNFEEEIAKDVWDVAESFQLQDVKDQCFNAMKNELTVSNCISVYTLAKKKGLAELSEKAQGVFEKAFNFGKIEEFLQLSTQDVMGFLGNENLENNLIWIAVINWIEVESDARKNDLAKLITVMNWEEFPSESLLVELWHNQHFSRSEICKAQIFQAVFMDLHKLEENLSLQNYFILQKISTQFMFLTKQTKECLSDFLWLNAIKLFEKEEFVHLQENEITQLCNNKYYRYVVPEEWRWLVAMKWVNYDPKRLDILLEIIPTFQFSQMAEFFKRENVMKMSEKNPNEAYYTLLSRMSCATMQERKRSFGIQISDERICFFDTTQGNWSKPVDEHFLDDRLKLKGNVAWYKTATGKWTALQTVAGVQLTGTENKANEKMRIKAAIYRKIQEKDVFDGSYPHVFVVGNNIVGLSIVWEWKNTCNVSLGIFNCKTGSWQKGIWQKRYYDTKNVKFLVIESTVHVIPCYSYTTISNLTLRKGEVDENTSKCLPFPITIDKTTYQKNQTDKWPPNVNNQLVIVTQYKVFILENVSKQWNQLSLPQTPAINAFYVDSIK